MASLVKLIFQAWDGQHRVLNFLDTQTLPEGVQTTLLTGQNGSHKSTILKELVAALTLKNHEGNLTLRSTLTPKFESPRVICASGSVADRFPSKEHGGRPTEFDVPNYIYIGQRVGTNLLSKKLPLETAVTFALDESVRNRFTWPFFQKAHKLAGIIPRVEFEFRRRRSSNERMGRSTTLLDEIQSTAGQENSTKKKPEHGISKQVAKHLAEQFTYDEFLELDYFLKKGRSTTIRLTLSDQDNIIASGLSPGSIRLGILAGELILSDAQIFSRRGGQKFSIFDLSSGEYHLFTTLIALGFSLQNGAVVLIDEPENSLHPQWQQEFMATLFEMCDFMDDGHLVISTHSPLIVSSAHPNSTIIDLSSINEGTSSRPIAFGASADEILFDQFGIASSRNPLVVELVQKAVNLVEHNLANSNEFTQIRHNLKEVGEQLRADDPLKDVIDALLERGD